jgi:cobalt-zinc-cadmium efflux system outer membrane protein
MRIVLAAALAVALAGSSRASAQVAGAQEPMPLTLEQLEQLALESNPTAVAAQAAIEAARGRARQAGAWPNPVVGYSAEELSGRGPGDPRGTHGLFVEQTVPLFGKLGLGRAVAEHAVDEAAQRAELQRQRILLTVRSRFYEILTAERRIDVHERLVALGTEAAGVTAQLFNVGAADQPDFLESEIATRRVQLDLNAARNQLFALRQQLAAVVGHPEVATRALAGSIDTALPELERDATIDALVERSPLVAAAGAAVARAEAVTRLAGREAYPNLFLRGGTAYNRERPEGGDRAIGWQGRIEGGVSIPLFNRNQGGIAAARADESRARAELERIRLSLRAQGAAEFASYLTAVGASEAYRSEILPRAEQAYALYLDRYRGMAAAYPQVLAAQRTLFETTREYLMNLDAGWRAAIRLEGLLAGDGLDAPAADAASVAPVAGGATP